jgi:putative PIN family toxin of toxin-antitoxin system
MPAHLAGLRSQVALEEAADARVGAADLIPFPGADRAEVKPELAGQRLLGEALGFTRRPDPPTKARGLRAGVVAKEAEDCRPEANVGRHTALLPIEESARVAADLPGSVPLLDVPVEAGTLQVLAHRPGLFRVSRGEKPDRVGGGGLTQLYGIAYDTTVALPRVVLDTNVLIAALRSKRGASARLLSLIGTGSFEVVLSVPLLLEYEAVFLRDLAPYSSERQTREEILDYLCAVAERQEIFFLWRPHLRDPQDEMVLEAAVAGGCGRIISFNKKDFVGAERFGVVVVTPREFLEEIGAVS